jgi:hypothetical protein
LALRFDYGGGLYCRELRAVEVGELVGVAHDAHRLDPPVHHVYREHVIDPTIGRPENAARSPVHPGQFVHTLKALGGVLLVIVLALAYYAGGYVAGRMSRFDGGRQGLGAWLIGLLVTVVLAVLGAVAGSEYNLLSQLNLPRIPIDEGSLAAGPVPGDPVRTVRSARCRQRSARSRSRSGR